MQRYGKRGIYYSKRLYHAVIRFITEDGTNLSRIERILENRFGVKVSEIDYDKLTKNTTSETGDRFQDFYPEELLQILNMFEEMPEGFHKIPNLKYLLRRNTGQDHPLYPTAPLWLGHLFKMDILLWIVDSIQHLWIICID